jgi:hypothetical protein
VAQLAQLKFGDDERLLDETGQRVNESGGHRVVSGRAFKMSIFCRSRGNEAQIYLETWIYLETPHVVSYFINGCYPSRWAVARSAETARKLLPESMAVPA